ncbi:LysM peptidoglycan-binding domain-containing protein [Pseudoxanthomonas mexicana]|uniref:LysM peptidoglycan-binding domain-containing protein n=1 Tax=Pseudoxanthomonas mexicana TaxID=128785 RepID=UPI00398B14B8
MFKSIRTVFAVAVLTVATYTAAAAMAETHPDTYVVKRGDTLWDISARFLKKPWLWPEIWQANPQISNPHLIYPGDVISLAYLDRVAVQPGPREEAPLNAIPLADIEPFLRNLRVVDSFEHLPHVAGLDGDRLRSTSGQAVYVLGLDGQPGQRYAVVRPTVRYSANPRAEDLDFRGRRTAGDADLWKELIPQTGSSEFLGYELQQVAVGTLTRGVVPGTETATLTVDAGGHEVRVGDRIIPVDAQPYDLHFFPHPPAAQAPEGMLRVLAVADTFTAGGPRDVVAISGGSRDGLDNGTVLSVWRQGSHTADRMKHPNASRISESPKSGAGRVSLPDEYAAHVMIFRTFDRVSYGLVMEGVKPARVGYALKHPDATY